MLKLVPGSPRDLDAIGDEIAIISAQIHAATARLSALIAEFDAREGWAGFSSCAHWLSWRCGFSPSTAREHVRVARALMSLPRISASFSRGELSYSKVRALTRVANTSNEATLLEWGRSGTATQIQTVVRGFKRAERLNDPDVRHKRRSVRWTYEEDGSVLLRARLEPEEGAIVIRALEAAAAQMEDDGYPQHASAEAPCGRADEYEDDYDAAPLGERRAADALVAIAESHLSRPEPTRAADRALVVIHTNEATLAGRAELLDGTSLHPETVRRIACDAGILRADVSSGDVGRKTRVVPRAMRRALQRRDRGCRFPGCRSRHVDAHHIVHWARGGTTSMNNLVLLCRRHHRHVHEGGYSISLAADGTVNVRAPNGRDVPESPRSPEVGPLHGPSVGPHTCEPRDGRTPDYGLAVAGLFEMRARFDTS